MVQTSVRRCCFVAPGRWLGLVVAAVVAVEVSESESEYQPASESESESGLSSSVARSESESLHHCAPAQMPAIPLLF